MLDLHFWLLLSKCSMLLATASSSTQLFWAHEAAVLGLNPHCHSLLGDILLSPPLFRVVLLCIRLSGIVCVWRAVRFRSACSGCFIDRFSLFKKTNKHNFYSTNALQTIGILVCSWSSTVVHCSCWFQSLGLLGSFCFGVPEVFW